MEPELLEKIKNLHVNEHLTVLKISEITGIPYHKIKYWLKRIGVHVPYIQRNHADVKKFYEAGIKPEEISRQLKISLATVYRVISKVLSGDESPEAKVEISEEMREEDEKEILLESEIFEKSLRRKEKKWGIKPTKYEKRLKRLRNLSPELQLIAEQHILAWESSEVDRAYCRDAKYMIWRNGILKLGKNRCQITGQKNVPLVVHHLYSWAHFPDKRFDLNNGVALCREVHIIFHKEYGYHYNTPEQFEEFKLRLETGDLKSKYCLEIEYVPDFCI